MPDMEIRAPRRRVRREPDRLWPVLTVVAAVFVGGFLLLQHFARQEAAAAAEAARQGQEQREQASREADIRERIRAGIEDDRQRRALPLNQLTTESGRTYYGPPSEPAAAAPREPTVAERYARASAIMESTRQASVSTGSDSASGNGVLRIADRVCETLFDRGVVIYRKCRADQWRHLRDGCIWRREQLTMATGQRYQDLKVSAEEWCAAESQYKIVD